MDIFYDLVESCYDLEDHFRTYEEIKMMDMMEILHHQYQIDMLVDEDPKPNWSEEGF